MEDEREGWGRGGEQWVLKEGGGEQETKIDVSDYLAPNISPRNSLP